MKVGGSLEFDGGTEIGGHVGFGKDGGFGFRAGAGVVPDILFLPLYGVRGPLPVVEAHAQHGEFPPDVHVFERPERAGHPLEHLRTEHLASEIDKREHHRLCAEEFREGDGVPPLVSEFQVERKLFAEPLLDPDLVKNLRPHRARLGPAGRGEDQRRRREDDAPGRHRFDSRSRYNSIALVTGTRTIPPAESVHP